jgi:hypothetical protein
MVTEANVFFVVMTGMFFTAILYVAFGQITVRKLRKNPETKNSPGIEFVSGWDIINVAQALAMPEFILRKFKNKKILSLFANTEILIKHTNKFDRILAFLFYWLLMSTGLFMAGWAALDVSGVL